MKYIIRKDTFETNSSSVHSLVISSEGREPSNLPVNDDGYIEVEFGQFGKDYHIYTEQKDKLSYLITCTYYLSHSFNPYDIYDSWTFKHINDVICKYTGAKGIKIIGNTEPYLDHQSQPYSDIEIINFYEDEIINFVFNKYVSLKTDCD